jgi:serine/threonine-protein kinase
MVAPVQPGDVLGGKYRVEKVLGEGGMGVVVAATHLQLDQRVAIKFMLPAAFDNAEALARFNREARAAVRLRSEHVARVLDTGTFETGAPYIVMEFMEGGDLAGELERHGPMPPHVAAEYIVQACDAIAEAHSLGIVHRDLKPANLFLTRRPDGSPLVKVLDFGISKAGSQGDAGLSMTKTSAVMGSPLYMSPEQMKSAKDVDARTDVWSLGVILYELLGGRTPFHAETYGELVAAVLTEPPQPLAGARPGLPPALCALVERCLRKDRSQRCQNVAEIARGLAPFCPPRVMPTVERIALVAGGGAAPAPAGSTTSPHWQTGLAPHATSGGATAPFPQTGGSWGGTLNPAEPTAAKGPPGRAAAIGVVAAGVVVLLVVGGAGIVHLTRAKVAPASSTPAEPASATRVGPPPAIPSALVQQALGLAAAAATISPPPSSTPPSEPSPTPPPSTVPTAKESTKRPPRAPPAAAASPPGKPAAAAPASQKPSIFDTSN